MVALGARAAHGPQAGGLFSGFHAFGHHRDGEAPGHAEHGGHDGLVLRRVQQVAHEALVHLQAIERQPAEIGQRGVAGAEVVDGDLHAERADRRQPRAGHAIVLQQHRFGEFQRQVPRGQAAVQQDLLQGVLEIGLDELPRRDVDVDVEAVRQLRQPPGDGVRGFAQHPFAEAQDQIGGFRHGDEHAGRHHAARGALPADQGLGADGAAGGELHDRLVVQHELTALQGVPQFGSQAHALQGALHHVRGEGHALATAHPLGLAERTARVAQPVRQPAGRQRAGHGPHGNGQLHFVLADRKRLGEDVLDGTPGIGRRGCLAGQVQEREFIAAQSRGERRRGQRAAHPVRRRLQQPVARVQTHAVVHRAEGIDARQHQHGPLGVGPVGFLQEAAAREQAGQRIAQQLPVQLLERMAQPAGHVVEGLHECPGFAQRAGDAQFGVPVAAGHALRGPGREQDRGGDALDGPQPQQQAERRDGGGGEQQPAGGRARVAEQVGLGQRDHDAPVQAGHLGERRHAGEVALAIQGVAERRGALVLCARGQEPGRGAHRLAGALAGEPPAVLAAAGCHGQRHAAFPGLRDEPVLGIDHEDVSMAEQGFVAQEALQRVEPYLGLHHAHGFTVGHDRGRGRDHHVAALARAGVDLRPACLARGDDGGVPRAAARVVVLLRGDDRVVAAQPVHLQPAVGAAVLQDQPQAAIVLAPDAGVFALAPAEAQQTDLPLVGIDGVQDGAQVFVDRAQVARMVEAMAADRVRDAALDPVRRGQEMQEPVAGRVRHGVEQAHAFLVDQPIDLAVLGDRLQCHGADEECRERNGDGRAQRQAPALHFSTALRNHVPGVPEVVGSWWDCRGRLRVFAIFIIATAGVRLQSRVARRCTQAT